MPCHTHLWRKPEAEVWCQLWSRDLTLAILLQRRGGMEVRGRDSWIMESRPRGDSMALASAFGLLENLKGRHGG